MDNFLIAKATDVGVTRQVNEDSMSVFDSPNGQVMVVCDGMGGQAAGDVASQLAVNIIENILKDNTFDTPEEAIRRSVLAANQGVLNRTAQNPELEGMGSTCVMLIIKDGRVYCGWVGDSRIYYIASHTIRQISHDQSVVQEMLDRGEITPQEAATHPQKNEVTNGLGVIGMTAPEIIPVPIIPEPGSVFLLCSDGLSGMVDERQIERVISNTKMSLQQKADRLVAMANEAGGLDNITVEMVQFGTSEVAGATSGTLFETPMGVNNSKKKSRRLLYSTICFLVVLVCCLGGGYYYMHQQRVQEKQTKTEVKSNTQKKSPKAHESDRKSVHESSTRQPHAVSVEPKEKKKKEVGVKNVINRVSEPPKNKKNENVSKVLNEKSKDPVVIDPVPELSDEGSKEKYN